MNKRNYIGGFTVLETIVVIVFTGIISTLIYSSMRRVNEQLQLSEQISAELNNWITIRSNLYNELYFCDSLVVKNQKAMLFIRDRKIEYENKENVLFRKEGGFSKMIDIEINSIFEEEINDVPNVVFEFHLKENIVPLSFPIQKGISKEINDYFKRLK